MIRSSAFAALLAAGFLLTLPSTGAQARFYDPGLLETSSQTEAVACRVVRERIRRPGGAVVYSTRRICTPGPRSCRTIRERVVRPGGAVVYRTIRRCR